MYITMFALNTCRGSSLFAERRKCWLGTSCSCLLRNGSVRSWNSLNLVKVLPRVQILPPITLTRCMRLFHLKYLPTGIQTQVLSTSAFASKTIRPLIPSCAVVGSMAQWLAYLLPDPAAPALIPSVHKNILRGKKSMLLRLISGAA